MIQTTSTTAPVPAADAPHAAAAAVEELAQTLVAWAHPLAARVVRLGMRGAAHDIHIELTPTGRTITSADRTLGAIVLAWGRGDDAAVARALAAWDVRDCEDCATRALRDAGSCRVCAQLADCDDAEEACA